ncbi:hypothetical protein BO79DRAFT_136275, partial [Aspergillus costaricaensis CBS 115574]
TILGNRISYVFNPQGQSYKVDTGYSSPSYTLDLACTALQNNECDLATIVHINLIQSPERHATVSQGGFLWLTSICHASDTSADG